jgi:hypothetical protein
LSSSGQIDGIGLFYITPSRGIKAMLIFSFTLEKGKRKKEKGKRKKEKGKRKKDYSCLISLIVCSTSWLKKFCLFIVLSALIMVQK